MNATNDPELRRYPPYRHILVATDFSAASRTAARWAAAIGRGSGARVTFVHAVHAPAGSDLPATVREEVTSWLRADELAVESEGLEGTSCFRPGRPWEIITELTEEIAPDLIVLGSRGRSGYKRVRLGSTADRVIRAAPAPVLTVRASDAAIEGIGGPVLIGTDFSPEAGEAVHEAMRLLAAMPGRNRVVLLHACDFPVEYGVASAAEVIATAREEEAEEAREYLNGLASELARDELDIEVSVREGYAATILEDCAEAMDAGLIALGTHGRSGLGHLMLGSVAERVLHHTNCPALTVNRLLTVKRAALAKAATGSTVTGQ